MRRLLIRRRRITRVDITKHLTFQTTKQGKHFHINTKFSFQSIYKVFRQDVTVGILATDGTLRSRLYHEALEEVGLVPMSPSAPGIQYAVMDALDSVKIHGVTEDAYNALAVASHNLASEGATSLVAGCTEVSLVFERHKPVLPWLDPLQILAEALVREAKGESENLAES